MKSRNRLNYANVASTTALVIALAGGGSAAFAMAVSKNSVGSPQIKNGAVKTIDLGKSAVVSSKIKNGAVKGTKVQDGSIGTKDLAARIPGVAEIGASVDGTTGAPTVSGYFSRVGGAPSVNRSGLGLVGGYNVMLPGAGTITQANTVVSVNATTGDRTCSAVVPGNPNHIIVLCHDLDGDLADSRFSVTLH